MTPGNTIQAIILAAGTSSRMGQPKQLLKVEGISMLDRTIGAALGAGIKQPILVLGGAADTILEKSKEASSCQVVINKDYASGQSSSLKAGVKQLSGACQGAIFLLCDQPLVDGNLVADLLTAFLEKKPDILYPTYLNQRGNPVIIHRSLFPRLLTATGDQGARFLFHDKCLNVMAYPQDNPAVLMDIDTPENYRLLTDKID